MSSQKFLPLPTVETGVVYNPMGFAMGDNNNSNRENHLYCGCCCDVRRATLVVNAISISMNVIAMIFLFFGVHYMAKNADKIAEDMDDDQAKQDFAKIAKNGTLPLIEAFADIFLIVSIFLHACGIYGALKYQTWGVAVAAVAYGLTLLIHLVSLNIIHVIIAGLFFYPHVILIKEMKEGIMTDYNYHNVASCCGTV
jgi:hypothetical protein